MSYEGTATPAQQELFKPYDTGYARKYGEGAVSNHVEIVYSEEILAD